MIPHSIIENVANLFDVRKFNAYEYALKMSKDHVEQEGFL